MSRDGVSVVIPVLDERESLEELHARLARVLDATARPWEVWYVDDGSTDGSWEVMRRLAAADPHVRLIRLRRTFGQSAALAAGIERAGHPIVVTLDADLQNEPGDIPMLLGTLEGGDYDVVSGCRRHRQDPWARRLSSWLANRLIGWVTGVHLRDAGCALKAYRRDVVRDVRLYGELHRFLPVLAAWVGARLVEIDVSHHPRKHGRSKYGFGRVLKVALDLMTVKFLRDYSAKPNYVFGGFGLVLLAAALAAFVVVAYRVLVLGRLEATPLVFLMVIFAVTGVISVFVGLLAELILRGQHEPRGAPTYYVAQTVGAPEDR